MAASASASYSLVWEINSDSAVAAVHGAEAGNSPGEDYDDASVDFELVNDVVYQHIDPAVIAIYPLARYSTFAAIIKIFYTLIIVDHGDLRQATGTSMTRRT